MSRFVLDHGRRKVSELLGGEGDEIVEEMRQMRVSDYLSFLRLTNRHSFFHFLITLQRRLVLRTAALRLSSGSTLT